MYEEVIFLEDSKAVLEITSDHRVNSLSEAIDFMESGGDFVFFPIESISAALALKVKEMVELSKNINLKWDYKDCDLNEGNDMYPKINHDKREYDNAFIKIGTGELYSHGLVNIDFRSSICDKEYAFKWKNVEKYFDHAYGKNSPYNDLLDILCSFISELKDSDSTPMIHYRFFSDSSVLSSTYLWHFDNLTKFNKNLYDAMIFLTDEGHIKLSSAT
jgi:hypothetical protein